MELKKNSQAPHSHTYIKNDYVSQLFGKVLYAIKNLIRRSILKAFNGHKILSDSNIHQRLIEKGLVKNTRTYSKSKIRDNHLILLIETGLLEKQKDGRLKRTSFGNDINEIISGVEEFDALPIPTHRAHQELNPERILLEFREGRKTYEEIRSKLNLPVLKGFIKRLKDKGLIKVNHPENLIRLSYLFRFSVSSYYHFIKGTKNCLKETGRSEFSVYWIITHLNRKWQAIFKRSMEINEAQELLKKGIETGSIKKTNGGYKASIEDLTAPIRDLTPNEKKILDLIKAGYTRSSTITKKSGFHRTTVHKILRKLEKKRLVEKYIEHVTIELTERGKRLADSLFKIKECVAREVGWV
ncbi:hypothetical protein KJA15_02735 [Patescibacteria group bacterium]|nr:hypothetical protein [Patescibacteria group bacterium]